MGLLRSFKKIILAIIASLILIIALYSITVKFGTDVYNLNQSKPKEKTGSQILGDKVYRRYWRLKDNDNFLAVPLKSIDQIRSQDGVLSSSSHSLVNSVMLDFSRCRMSNCFDFSRCQSDGPLKVHIVPSWQATQNSTNETLGESNIIHRKILKIIRQSKHFEPDASKACIFILEADTLDRDPLSQSFVPNMSQMFDATNRFGMNHLVFNLYSGSWPDYKEDDFAGLNFGAAILAKASNSILHHRPGFDISLPLFSYLHPASDSDRISHQAQGNRSYFLTFKGKRYVIGQGSETRNSLYHLHNQRDTLMLTTCRHGKKWRESSDSRCSKDEANYDKYDFNELLKESRFCLTPRGRRLGSFRYLEALSYGCIPVILSDGWVRPFDEIIDWSCASVQFVESLLLQVADILKDLDLNTTNRMRKNCINLYDEYFSSIEKIILSTLSIIERRIKNRLNNQLPDE